MKKVEIKSTLLNITDQVFAETDVNKGKKIVLDHVVQCGIKDVDKKRIQMNLEQIRTHVNLWRYVSNLILKYEGLGISW
jgi:hypothetical protein